MYPLKVELTCDYKNKRKCKLLCRVQSLVYIGIIIDAVIICLCLIISYYREKIIENALLVDYFNNGHLIRGLRKIERKPYGHLIR